MFAAKVDITQGYQNLEAASLGPTSEALFSPEDQECTRFWLVPQNAGLSAADILHFTLSKAGLLENPVASALIQGH